MNIDAKAISQLKMFVKACEMNPTLLHEPNLLFFKEYLVSLGATIPPKPAAPEPAAAPKAEEAAPKPEPSKIPTPEPTPEPEPMEDSSEEEEIELDNTGVIEGEDLMDLPMGDENKEVSEEDVDKANELRREAMSAMSDGNLDEAIRLFGEGISRNPHSAVLFAKRAQTLLRQKKPNNVLRDAEKALVLNPNNALAHKCKGKAYRLLGMWEESALALSAGQKCDYDDDTQELLKTVVKPNAEKLRAARLKKESSKREKEHKAKLERVRAAKEARQKAYEEAKAREAEAGPGGMGGMGGLFDDPEIATLLQDPEVVQAMADIQQNPQNMMKYMSNPKVMKVITKLQGKFMGGGGGMGGMPGGMGGMGGMPGGMGGMPGGMGDMPGGMGGMPGGFPGGMPGGFPGGMAGASAPNFTADPPSSTGNNANTGAPPPPPFTASCDDVD